MDSLKQNVTELTQLFHARMAEFQQELQHTDKQVTSPSSKIATEFQTFKKFIILALNTLQQQTELLAKRQDEMDMRSRRKILLVHGVPEDKAETLPDTLTNLMAEHLHNANFNPEVISRCHRMGVAKSDKPRVIMLKFRDMSVRQHIWYAKTGFKSTGITLSEFLTKSRHDTFIAARQRFGVTRCWTRDGCIIVAGEDGSRHRVTCMPELNAIPIGHEGASEIPASGIAACKGKTVPFTRPKRLLKGK